MYTIVVLSLAHSRYTQVSGALIINGHHGHHHKVTQLSGHYHPRYALNNKTPVTFSVSLRESHSCIRNSITYFGSFIKGMAAQLGQVSLKAHLNDMGHTTRSQLQDNGRAEVAKPFLTS